MSKKKTAAKPAKKAAATKTNHPTLDSLRKKYPAPDFLVTEDADGRLVVTQTSDQSVIEIRS